jgi:hypothetical protein
MIQKVSSHIYIFFLFVKTCPCVTHIFILLALHQNPLNIIFLGSFRSFRNCRGSFYRTCPGIGFPSYIRGLSAPLETRSFFLFHFISCGGQGLSRHFWIYSTESLQFLGDLTPLPLRIFKPYVVFSLLRYSQGSPLISLIYY